MFYDDGVPLEKLTGEAMGIGIFDKDKDGYRKIAESYKPGDDIFIFEFSRGAFTARSIAEMISTCGLPTAPFNDKLIDQAFKACHLPMERASILKDLCSYTSL